MKKNKKLNWNHCYIFYVLAQTKNVTQAAKRLNLAPSTISEQISTLENNLGSTLFVRSSKGLSLNEFGAQFFEHSRRIFDEGQKLLDIYVNDQQAKYPVNIAIESTPLIAECMLLVNNYADWYSDSGSINLFRKTSVLDIVRSIFESKIDWGLSIQTTKHRSIIYEELGSYTIQFMYHEDLEEKYGTTHEILRNVPIILPSNTNLAQQIERHLNKFLLYPSKFVTSQFDDFSRFQCDSGLAVWCVGPNENYDPRHLKSVNIGEPFRLPLYALWKKEASNLSAIQGVLEVFFQESQVGH